MMAHPPTITFRMYRVNMWALSIYSRILAMINRIKRIEHIKAVSHSVEMSGNYYVILVWVTFKWA